MTDREFVEQHWVTPGVYRVRGVVSRKEWNVLNLYPGIQVLASAVPGTKADAWTAAAQFTRDRLEEIRQIEMEIKQVDYQVWNMTRGFNESIHPHNAALFIQALHRWSRIKARLEAQLAELKRGMKA